MQHRAMQNHDVQSHDLAEEIQRQVRTNLDTYRSEIGRPPVHLTAPQWQSVETALRSIARSDKAEPRIDPRTSETGFMVLAAVRYSLGRPSNVPSLCTTWLKEYWPGLREEDRAEVIRDVERFIAAEEPRMSAEAWTCNLQPWRDFLAWAAGDAGDEARKAAPERLAPLARYRLEILARGSRSYSARDPQILALQKRGLVAASGPDGNGTRRAWTITERGREVLANASD